MHTKKPYHPTWTGWRGTGSTRNPAYHQIQESEVFPLFASARHNTGMRYDHRTRRYRIPGPGVWSDVVRGYSKGSGPLYTRDWLGQEWVSPYIDGGRFNAGIGSNPFRY